MAIAAHDVFIGGELLDPDRAARMEFARGNTDLGPHPEFAAIGKLGRGVVHGNGAVHMAEEILSGLGIFGEDTVGML